MVVRSRGSQDFCSKIHLINQQDSVKHIDNLDQDVKILKSKTSHVRDGIQLLIVFPDSRIYQIRQFGLKDISYCSNQIRYNS